MRASDAVARFPAVVRVSIRRQHDGLRDVLEVVDDLANRTLRDPGDAPRLADAVATLAARFEAHLRHEELELVPILEVAPTCGPAVVASLRAEHEEQRAWMRELLAVPSGVASARALASEALALCVALRLDMADEERWLEDVVREAEPVYFTPAPPAAG